MLKSGDKVFIYCTRPKDEYKKEVREKAAINCSSVEDMIEWEDNYFNKFDFTKIVIDSIINGYVNFRAYDDLVEKTVNKGRSLWEIYDKNGERIINSQKKLEEYKGYNSLSEDRIKGYENFLLSKLN